MKEYNNIDELFREGLKDLKVMPSSEVWQKISKGLPDSGIKPVIGTVTKWILGTTTAILMGLAVYFIYTKTSEDSSPKSFHKETIIKTEDDANDINKTTDNHTDKIITLEKGKSKTKSAPSPIKTKSFKTASNYSDQTANKNIQASEENNTEDRNLVSDLSNQTESTENSPKQAFGSSKANVQSSKNASPITGNYNDLKRAIRHRPAGTGKGSFNNKNSDHKATEGYTPNGIKSPLKIYNSKENNGIKSLALDSRNLTNTDGETGMLFPEDQTIIHNQKQVSQIKKRIHTYTGASLSTGMICYSTSKEKQITWAAEGIVGMNIKKLYLETGVGYRSMKQTGNYRIDYKTYDSIGYYNEVTSFEVDPNNDQNIILHYKETVVFDSIHHVAYTSPDFTYRYLTLPIKAGYSFWNRKRLFLTVEAGMEYNRLMKSVIPESGFNQPGDISEIINQTETRNLNTWKINAGIRFGYRISNNILLIIQPGYSKYINSIYNTEKGYSNDKPCILNIKGGIMIDF